MKLPSNVVISIVSPVNLRIISIKYFPGITIDPTSSILITCVPLTSSGKNVLIVISESLDVRNTPTGVTTILIPNKIVSGDFVGNALLMCAS